MHENEVIYIPANDNLTLGKRNNRQLRVASYSRVSTDAEEQLTSFHSQKSYYTDLIMRTPEWTLAGTYADEGISGASAEKRPSFMNMIRQCKKGKIDLIITKSISRFARNTMDSIKYVRLLKGMGIGVIFEKEGINTLEENSEVVLTILSSLAQEELNSLSLNVKMGKRMAMKDGKTNFVKMYAYQKGDDGKPEIIPQEAEIIKTIYKLYLDGASIKKIADDLNENKIKSHGKDGTWKVSTISSILQNERYCGDVLLQKTYVTDPISKKVKRNNGELPKYLIKNNHPAIISRDIFNKAQEERAKRLGKQKVSKLTKTEQGKYCGLYALSEILICGECLSPYRRVVWHRRNGEKTPVWRCINRIENGTKYCKESATIDEESLHTAIMESINHLRGNKQEMIPIFLQELKKEISENAKNSFNIDDMEKQLAELKENIMTLVKESIANNTVSANESKLKAMNDEVKELNDNIMLYKKRNTNSNDKFIHLEQRLKHESSTENKYDDNLVRELIDTIKVIGDNKLQIIFKCGITYEQEISIKINRLNKNK